MTTLNFISDSSLNGKDEEICTTKACTMAGISNLVHDASFESYFDFKM